MSSPDHAWRRLAAAARRSPVADDRDTAAPYGFAARVAARAFGGELPRISLIEQFSLRALGIAGMLAAITAGVGYPTIAKVFAPPAVPATAISASVPAAGSEWVDPAAPDLSSPDASPASVAPSDDPVAELVDIVS
jgi:hypothetical protein